MAAAERSRLLLDGSSDEEEFRAPPPPPRTATAPVQPASAAYARGTALQTAAGDAGNGAAHAAPMGALADTDSDSDAEDEAFVPPPPALQASMVARHARRELEEIQATLDKRGRLPRGTHVERFDLDARNAELVVGSVAADDVEFLSRSTEELKAQAAESAAALQRRRLDGIERREQAARAREQAAFEAKKRAVEAVHAALAAKRAAADRRMETAFWSAGRDLGRMLRRRARQVREQYGIMTRSGVRFGVQDSSRELWKLTPQPVSLWVDCLRAVRDKVPSGRYSVHVKIFDRLGGSLIELHHSEAQGAPKFSTYEKTGPQQHSGRVSLDATEVTYHQRLRLTLPAHIKLGPSTCYIFEVVQLKGRHNPVDEVVAWGAFPVCNGALDYVQGDFKVPLLLGTVDSAINKYGMIDKLICEDLDHWLCNLYFSVALDARTQGKGGTSTSEFFAQQEYIQHVLGLDVPSAGEGDGTGNSTSVGVSTAARPSGKSGGAASTPARVVPQLHDYQFSVRAKRSARALTSHGHAPPPVDRMKLLWRELKGEVLAHRTNELNFWVQLLLLVTAFFTRMFLHFMAQLVFLTAQGVPVIRFGFGYYGCGEANTKQCLKAETVFGWELVYDIQQLSPYTEVGVIASGFGFVIAVQLAFVLVTALWLCFTSSILDQYYLWVSAWCFVTTLDPCFIFLVDLLKGNAAGDAYKLYNVFKYREGSGGEVGIGITLLIYIIGVSVSFVISYIYFMRLHHNGRIQDLLQRLAAREGRFHVPQDDEISYDELEYICSRCQRFNDAARARAKRLKQPPKLLKEVTVEEFIVCDRADASKKETKHHIMIHDVRGESRKMWRHFLRHDDGCVHEILVDLSKSGRQRSSNRAKMEMLRNNLSTHGTGGEGGDVLMRSLITTETSGRARTKLR